MTVNLQVDSLGDAYYLLLFAKQYAEANNVDININVKQGRENYRNAKSGTPLANTKITGRESPEEIKRKAENIIFSITRLYKDTTGNIETFDNRDSYRFRFLKTPRTQPEDVSMTAFHRGKIAIPVFKNCVVAAIARKLHKAYQGRNRKILIALDEKVRENGFNTKDAKKYLAHLPADFYFVSPDGPFLEVINRDKYSSKRHDIKKIVIMVELGHAKLYEPSIMKAKKEHIIGDSSKILAFARDYGLPVSGDIRQPFIVSERSNVIFKSYKPEYDPKSLNRVQDIKNKFFSTSKSDLNVYDPLIDYYRHSRKYICYRDADLNRDEYVKVDINGAYHTAMMQVKFPEPGAEAYKLVKPMIKFSQIEEVINDFTGNKIEGLFYCEYKTEWPGHLDKLRQHENDWISIDMAKRLAVNYNIYPDSISHIIFNRRTLDVNNFDSDWLNELRYAKITSSSKKDFNSLVGSLCPSRVTKQRLFQHQDDLNMFLAQANIKKYNIYDWHKTGGVTTSVCVDNGKTNWKSVWNGVEEVERANVEEFEDIEIIYSDPNDKRTGLPSFQAAIVNHVSFTICETANRIEKETGKKVYSIWTDSIAYKKEYTGEDITDICILCDGEGCDPVDFEECTACSGTGEISQSIRYEDKSKRLDLEQLKEWSGFTWKDEEFKKVSDSSNRSQTYKKTDSIKRYSTTPYPPQEEHFNEQSEEKLLELSKLPKNCIWYWPGEAGCGKTYQVNSYNLSGVKITSAQKTVNKEFSSQTIQSATRFFPNTEKNLNTAINSDKVGVWTCHSHEASGKKSFKLRDALRNRNYIVIDEFTKSPHECIEQAKKKGAVIILLGDPDQMYRIGEKKYDVLKQNDVVISRPLEGNYRFKHENGDPHDDWYNLCRDIRKKVGCDADPENIYYGNEEYQIIRMLSARNERMSQFIDYFLMSHPALKDKFIDEDEAMRRLKLDKENTVVLASVNKTVEYNNSNLSNENNSSQNCSQITIGDIVRPTSTSNLPTGLTGKVTKVSSHRNKRCFVVEFSNGETKRCSATTIRLAYAQTISSSQGLTIEKNVILDLDRIKCMRDLYVGLTRCKYPDNLRIVR
jgi:hypothetical protein